MKRERDERLEAARLVLQRAQAEHVIDAVLERLDVPVEHRRVGAHAEAVRDACTSRYSSAVALSCEMRVRTSGWKISAPPPGRLSRPAARSFVEHLVVGHPVVLGEEVDLHRGEALEVRRRA